MIKKSISLLKDTMYMLVLFLLAALILYSARVAKENYISYNEALEAAEEEQHLGVDKLCFITTITPTCKDVKGVEFLDEACAVQIVKRLDNYPNLRIRWLHSLRGGNLSIRMEDCKSPVVLKPGYI